VQGQQDAIGVVHARVCVDDHALRGRLRRDAGHNEEYDGQNQNGRDAQSLTKRVPFLQVPDGSVNLASFSIRSSADDALQCGEIFGWQVDGWWEIRVRFGQDDKGEGRASILNRFTGIPGLKSETHGMPGQAGAPLFSPFDLMAMPDRCLRPLTISFWRVSLSE